MPDEHKSDIAAEIIAGLIIAVVVAAFFAGPILAFYYDNPAWLLLCLSIVLFLS